MKTQTTIKIEFYKKLYRKIANIDNGISSLVNFLVDSEITEYNVPKLIDIRLQINTLFKDILKTEYESGQKRVTNKR